MSLKDDTVLASMAFCGKTFQRVQPFVGKQFHAKPLDLGNTKPLAILQDCIGHMIFAFESLS